MAPLLLLECVNRAHMCSIKLLLQHYAISNPFLSATMSRDIVLMTSHLCAQGIEPLCQALGIAFELTLLLHPHVSSKLILMLQHSMTLRPWLTEQPFFIRLYGLMPLIKQEIHHSPCHYGHRLHTIT